MRNAAHERHTFHILQRLLEAKNVSVIEDDCPNRTLLRKTLYGCPCQKLGWPTLSEISCTQLPDVPDQTSSGRASFHKNSTSHSKRAHGSFCIFTRAFGSLFRSGSLTRVKMMQAADFWNLDYMTE